MILNPQHPKVNLKAKKRKRNSQKNPKNNPKNKAKKNPKKLLKSGRPPKSKVTKLALRMRFLWSDSTCRSRTDHTIY